MRSCNAPARAPDDSDARTIGSVAALSERLDADGFDAVRAMFEIGRTPSARLAMSPAAWEETRAAMKLPRDAVENQVLTFIRDRNSGHEVIVNTVRGRRSGAARPRASAAARAPAPQSCRWCSDQDAARTCVWSDPWDPARSADGRIGTRPNWARQSTVSGLVFGDAGMHYLDSLSESGFVGLFETGERYLANARRVRPQARFAALFCNGGPKSAGSVEHSHVQITAREDRHFAYAEEIARRCPPDYWERLHRAHAQAGLTIRWSECPAWVNLAPLKERDITVLSADLRSGAQSTYRIWRALARSGTRDFTLAAILAPGYVAGEGATPRFARWPNVVWRFVDRGDPEVRHGDIGAMELFASAVVANDPYGVAALLREAQP